MKLSIKETECSCHKCSSMCHSPCTGTPEDMEAIMDAGYGDRLMYDDWPCDKCADIIKPALKGYEGKMSPWETSSIPGCTFWKDGKCELHSLGLKPTLAKLVIHDQSDEEQAQISDFICQSWETEKAKKVIEKWKKINKKNII